MKTSIVISCLILISIQALAGVSEKTAVQGTYSFINAYCSQDGSLASSPFKKLAFKGDTMLAYGEYSDLVPNEVIDLTEIISKSTLHLGDIADGASRSGNLRLKVAKLVKINPFNGKNSFYIKLEYYSNSNADPCGFGATSLIFVQ